MATVSRTTYALIPDWLFELEGLTRRHLIVYTHLARMAACNGRTLERDMREIADESGYGRSAVYASVRWLIDAGAVVEHDDTLWLPIDAAQSTGVDRYSSESTGVDKPSTGVEKASSLVVGEKTPPTPPRPLSNEPHDSSGEEVATPPPTANLDPIRDQNPTLTSVSGTAAQRDATSAIVENVARQRTPPLVPKQRRELRDIVSDRVRAGWDGRKLEQACLEARVISPRAIDFVYGEADTADDEPVKPTRRQDFGFDWPNSCEECGNRAKHFGEACDHQWARWELPEEAPTS